ncbi:MAG: hypothetical protein HN758_04205 [Verrucomicrobia bacterium]|nr:hypothetical protein [Verrucomicrobiota bacterium]MBT4275901.1 hypothetical protein [Verrucomicrobiota bacterium]MBT5061930.1 hypothetical protein [Verrucomicrobiota bacterium]MBT6237326.1 hypothetical protein [Verrucomicrobiota bacterium]MBT7873610.1 hypothetical protein [Verrucomicrobiota bacterium]
MKELLSAGEFFRGKLTHDSVKPEWFDRGAQFHYKHSLGRWLKVAWPLITALSLKPLRGDAVTACGKSEWLNFPASVFWKHSHDPVESRESIRLRFLSL